MYKHQSCAQISTAIGKASFITLLTYPLTKESYKTLQYTNIYYQILQINLSKLLFPLPYLTFVQLS